MANLPVTVVEDGRVRSVSSTDDPTDGKGHVIYGKVAGDHYINASGHHSKPRNARKSGRKCNSHKNELWNFNIGDTMKTLKCTLILSILFLSSCSFASQLLTPEVDKKLNWQNRQAANSIIENPIGLLEVVEVAKDIKKNSEQLALGSVGVPENTLEEYDTKRSEQYRQESKNEADWSFQFNKYTSWIPETPATTWVILLLSVVGTGVEYLRRKREQKLKTAVYEGVEKYSETDPYAVEDLKDLISLSSMKNKVGDILSKDVKAWRKRNC